MIPDFGKEFWQPVYVGRQPANEQEVALADDAISQCPTGTIGSDG
jgi:ferredoxin